MPLSIIPTEEVAPNHLFGDFSLFDHCAFDESPKHKYQFKIADARATINNTIEAFVSNPKDIEALESYNFSVAGEFCYQAFLKNYSFDSRSDFLDYQFTQTPAKESFLNRVRNLLASFNWNSLEPLFCYSKIKESEVLKWLDDKHQSLETGKVKKTLTHRHHALIYWYKARAGDIPNVFPRTLIRERFGKAREREIDKLWNKKSEHFRPPNIKELTKIIPHLRLSLNAYKLAINEMEGLK